MPQSNVARRAIRTALVVVVVGSIVTALVWGLQRRLIYLPSGDPPPIGEVLPQAEEVGLGTADGLVLSAWFLPAGPTAVAVFPGNAGNRSDRSRLARALAAEGLSVLLVDYRGYGGNSGRPSEEGLRLDAEAAARWLDSRDGVEQVVYFGESLGAAVAISLARDRPPAALVLRSPFTMLGDVARHHYGPVPNWLLRDHYPSVQRIGEVDAPVLVLAAKEDTIVPFEQSRRVFEAAREPKEFVAIPDVGHNDPDLLDGHRMIDAIASFLDAHGIPRAP